MRAEAELSATPFTGKTARAGFVSASLLAQKAKQFDDGLYAAVELTAQSGAGTFAGKTRLLRTLAERLASDEEKWSEGHELVLGAARISGVYETRREAKRVQRRLDSFLKAEVRSKPISFYTWSPELASIFRQDRFLQTPFEDGSTADALVIALTSTPHAVETYEAYLELVERLTNPFPPEWGDLRPSSSASNVAFRAFFPPSRSPESELVKRLGVSAADRPLLDVMIEQIRSGEIDLAPVPESGWYDHQLWSLEPLVAPDRVPEAKKLWLGPMYRAELEQLFKGLLAMTRETHIKQLEIVTASAEMVDMIPIRISPRLTVEPLPSHYHRRALSYRFVRNVLVDAFGESALDSLHRLTPTGSSVPTLAVELETMERLFLGACASSCLDLGLPFEEIAGNAAESSPADLELFSTWSDSLHTDPDLAQDNRMMVPLFLYPDGRMRVAALLGWTSRTLEARFNTPPIVDVFDETGRKLDPGEIDLQLEKASYGLKYPVLAEVDVTRLLDREEFRARCDSLRTKSAIIASLQ